MAVAAARDWLEENVLEPVRVNPDQAVADDRLTEFFGEAKSVAKVISGCDNGEGFAFGAGHTAIDRFFNGGISAGQIKLALNTLGRSAWQKARFAEHEAKLAAEKAAEVEGLPALRVKVCEIGDAEMLRLMASENGENYNMQVSHVQLVVEKARDFIETRIFPEHETLESVLTDKGATAFFEGLALGGQPSGSGVCPPEDLLVAILNSPRQPPPGPTQPPAAGARARRGRQGAGQCRRRPCWRDTSRQGGS